MIYHLNLSDEFCGIGFGEAKKNEKNYKKIKTDPNNKFLPFLMVGAITICFVSV